MDVLYREASSVPAAGGEETPEQAKTREEKEMIELAISRFTSAEEAEMENRGKALDDLRFSVGEQWPADIKSARNLEQRPCLTINRAPAFIRLVTNEQRQNKPEIRVSPAGDGADADTAEIEQGLIRHIERQSHAFTAYTCGLEMAVRMGWGAWRLVIEFESERSFNQVIKIKKIENPFMVYMDPYSTEPDKSDAEWGFIFKDYPIRQYRKEFGKSRLATESDLFSSIGDNRPSWVTKDTVRVAEYFHAEYEDDELVELESGETKFLSDLEPEDKGKPNGLHRKVKRRKMVWSKINAVEELDSRTWPGRFVPIIIVVGDEVNVDGKKIVSGMIRDYKDPQRRYNYMVSAEAEAIALAPKAPYVGAKGQFAGKEQMWRTANVKSYPYLEYDPVTINGQAAPPPQRTVLEPPINAIGKAIAQADNDMKSVTSLYDASLGERGPEQSGKAILARKVQGNIANANYGDNLNIAIGFTGTQIIELIPHVYKIPQVVRIVNPDGSFKLVGVYNSQHFDKEDAEQQLGPKLVGTLDNAKGMDPDMALKKAIGKIYDVGVGKYDLVVDAGPSYLTRRQESAASMIEFAKAFPNAAALIADIVAGEMDWPGAKMIQKRLMEALPPGLKDQDEDPNAEEKLKQITQQYDALVQELNAISKEFSGKKMELDSKERIASMGNQTNLAIAELKTHSAENLEVLRNRLNDLHATLDREMDRQKAEAEQQQVQQQMQMQQQQAAQAPQPGGTQ